jgi:cyclic pyranopterin monophosphate synthase
MSMIDISKKKITLREAVAEGKIILKPAVLLAIKKKAIPKGEVLETAKVAGILAAKRTAELIPLCHPLSAEYINIEFAFMASALKIKTTVKGSAKTGMEMEALIAASITALTIYDMCKPLDKHIVISGIKLLKKTGGKSEIEEKQNG